MARKSAKKKVGFDEEIYKRLGINNLILFGIYSITSKQKKCTFEKLMKECKPTNDPKFIGYDLKLFSERGPFREL